MQDYYAARAQEYDRIYAKPERQTDLRSMESWLSGALAGRRVLELACGTGYWTQFYALAANGVVAIESAQETLHIARSRVPAEVQLLVGDAYRPPQGETPFDGSFAGFWWSHIPLQRIPFLTFLIACTPRGHLERGSSSWTTDSSRAAVRPSPSALNLATPTKSACWTTAQRTAY